MTRLRRKSGTMDYLAEQAGVVYLKPQEIKGRWSEQFGVSGPIHVELGMGKGKFISEMSIRYPNTNFIGVDMYDELIRKGVEKAEQLREELEHPDRGNLKFALFNIEHLLDVFSEGEVERIYLNFSDPWPKARHAFRRLTHPRFVEKYKHILNERGEIHLKTDSLTLFEFSLNSFADLNLKMRSISLDLHREGVREDLVMTEYESKFTGQGMSIYRCEVLVGSEAVRSHEAAAARAAGMENTQQ